MRTSLYFAYGSNLNIIQMRRRCPTAKPICSMTLKGWRLVFRGVADVVPDPESKVPGGLWRITESDEAALDTYEGVRGGLYRKVYIPITTFEGQTSMLMYVMNSDGIYPPSQGYLDGIIDGYKHFRLDDNARRLLNEALADAWDDKRPSWKEHARNERKGYPKLARPHNDNCQNCGFCRRKPESNHGKVWAGHLSEDTQRKIAKVRRSFAAKIVKPKREDWKISKETIVKLMTEQCSFEWKGGRCAREKGHPNGHRIQ